MTWYIEALKKYTTFSGRSRRKEYWMFMLFNILISIVFSLIDSLTGLNHILSRIYYLAIIIPSIAVAVRRLHDTGKNGWWYFINILPIIGSIWFLVLMCMDSQNGENQYGRNPKELN